MYFGKDVYWNPLYVYVGYSSLSRLLKEKESCLGRRETKPNALYFNFAICLGRVTKEYEIDIQNVLLPR